MEKEDLKGKILDVIKKYPVGSVATIRDGKPWVRYMAMQPGDDLALYSTSFANARKVAQINKDHNVHVAFGADPKDWGLPYVNVEGRAEVLTDLPTKKKCWHDMLSQFFEGPEDPNYVVVKVVPETIEFTAPGAHRPEIYRI
jgi:general stress protein 26